MTAPVVLKPPALPDPSQRTSSRALPGTNEPPMANTSARQRLVPCLQTKLTVRLVPSRGTGVRVSSLMPALIVTRPGRLQLIVPLTTPAPVRAETLILVDGLVLTRSAGSVGPGPKLNGTASGYAAP